MSNAYQILSDDQKRATYDRGGEEALKEGGAGGGGMDPSDIFSMFFGGGGGGGRGGGRQQVQKTKSMQHQLSVSLGDLYKGKVSKLAIQRQIICIACKGAGGKPGAVQTCKQCRGQGFEVKLRPMGPGMMQQVQVACSNCSGQGEVINEKDRCNSCLGKKTVQERKILEVTLFPLPPPR